MESFESNFLGRPNDVSETVTASSSPKTTESFDWLIGYFDTAGDHLNLVTFFAAIDKEARAQYARR